MGAEPRGASAASAEALRLLPLSEERSDERTLRPEGPQGLLLRHLGAVGAAGSVDAAKR